MISSELKGAESNLSNNLLLGFDPDPDVYELTYCSNIFNITCFLKNKSQTLL